MKIWFGYGSDHSANLVMIGEFKTEQDAARVVALIEEISDRASSDLADGIIDYCAKNERLSENTEARIRNFELYNLSPADIADFALLGPSIVQKGKALHFHSDNEEIGGFVKLMVARGAKVQVYSAHEYPQIDDE